MAQVLAPIVQTSGSITMSYPSSDAYQNPTTTQQPRASQTSRNQTYNNTSGGTGYRGTSAPIAPYAFSSTPQLRLENRSVSAPNPQALQQPPSQANQARLGHPSHPSSSSDSTVSTSGSSNRSLPVAPLASKDDSDLRKPVDSMASSITLSTAIPDLSLSLSLGDAPVKPSPGRYRRGAGRTDSSTSIPTGASTPTQRSPLVGTSTFGSSQPSQDVALGSSEISPPARPGHNRANSADDTQLLGSGGTDAAKRYRRRSFNGLEEKTVPTNVASLQVGANAAQSAALSTPKTATKPVSRPTSRPASSHSHERQGSAGSVSSNASARSQVCCTTKIRVITELISTPGPT
ncbi:uncharacterized protein K460DRAFT_162543 [Cucurbitaria berberidis CBS 394.84]|uniref:Uncharacterized protein n=1 Tax=Cucurbitaria berberidis CBS 394.84 TaxID=1168544 RepID=A0A9P4GFC0_9PLEO|nr:uncharacterized protein K460DRAFT_162543 [Cucurbitaria berberidis CBS 394.84]KAF1844332.1 hypothetical protein K460DRAFT_162543 [Cucurbitaria berberidis CBS 394.84]